jgi:phage baseplate assembly protein W
MSSHPLDPSKAFLGSGWAFPVAADTPRTDVQVADYDEDVRQAVRIILETNPGERVMRPDFGAGLRALAFEPLDVTTQALARRQVEQALTLWEPRIDLQEVLVTSNGPAGRLDIDIRYRVRVTNTFYNLVFPFYLQEGRE